MFQPLYVAATGLESLQEEMTDITNNLANAKSVAFKQGRVDMESLTYIPRTFDQELQTAMSKGELVQPRTNVEFGTGVNVAATTKDFKQGTLDVTSNPLDLAVSGEGFFAVKLADGSMAYTRAGNFHLDNDGNLVDANGHLLDPSIQMPSGTTAVTVQQDGTVYAAINGSTELTQVGQISLVRFPNTQGLTAIGQNLFQATAASGDAQVGSANENGFGAITQYALEGSNVDVISEMMRMVMVQRIFDTVSKAVQSYESMLTALGNIKQS